MSSDDLDDVLDDREADLEARFRELERQAEIDRLRAESGAAPRAAPEGEPAPPPGQKAGAPDPLADLKAAVEGSAELPLYLLVLCPHCEGKNRVSLAKVRSLRPICGRCKKDLAFPKSG